MAGVMLVMLVLLIMVPAVVQWVRQGTLSSVKNRNSTTALNLAETAVDRGYWKAKSSTSTIAAVLGGSTIAGYNFDTTYRDVSGGSYRVRMSSTTSTTVTIVGEGRDSANKETRAITAVYQNRTIFSPILSQGDINWFAGLGFYWGPLMSQGNITLDATTALLYSPRKFARGNVIGTAANPRNVTWPLPPNTDGVEWWSNYQSVPEVPVLDFAALRASAIATNTLNVYGCKNSSTYTNPTNDYVAAGNASWSTGANSYSVNGTPFTGTVGAYAQSCTGTNCYFCNSFRHPKGAKTQPNTSYTWFWDGDLTLAGYWDNGVTAVNNSTGLYGNIIVRGNLTIDTPGEYNYTGHVPANAWKDEQKLTATTKDTSAAQEYPADLGQNSSNSTFEFGTDTWSGGWRSTVGIRGFTYVGGNLNITQFMDFNGAIWVNGSVNPHNPSATAYCGVFYDDTLAPPTLNVVLVRTGWQETAPSATAWN